LGHDGTHRGKKALPLRQDEQTQRADDFETKLDSDFPGLFVV
jgi:hypothetical protein